jgi:aryl-alcohol dehydrogenase-like predicted oxidoreductase
MDNKKLLRHLGNSELMVTPIGLGTWQFSKRNNLAGRFWPFLSEEESHEIVKTSLNNGINWFDTAEMYGGGESEKTLSRALQQSGVDDKEVIIATKWNPILRTARSITKTIGNRQEALAPYTISLHQVHNPASFSNIKAEMKAMAKLVKDQKIKYVGVSNFSASQMRKAHEELQKHGLKLVSNQVRYNLLYRKIEQNGILETARELNVAIIAYSPLAQGILTGKYHENPDAIRSKKGFRKNMGAFKESGLYKTRPLVDKLKEMAEKYDATAAQVALNWTVNSHGNSVVAIPGASNTRQAESNAKAMQINLSEEDMDQIDQASLDIGK